MSESSRPPPTQSQIEFLINRDEDIRTFGDILSAFQEYSNPSDPEGFLTQTLKVEGIFTVQDFIEIISDVKAPTNEFVNLVATLIPPCVATDQLVRSRGANALRVSNSELGRVNPSQSSLLAARTRILSELAAGRPCKDIDSMPSYMVASTRFAGAIRALRSLSGITQDELCKKVGRNAILVESGSNPSSSLIDRYAELFSLQVKETEILRLLASQISDDLRVARRVTDVVDTFSGRGMTVDSYLQAILKHPRLLQSSTSAVIANLESLLRHLSHDSPPSKCIATVCREPRILTESATTVSTRIDTLRSLIFGDVPTAVWSDLFVKNPSILCRSAEGIVDTYNGFCIYFCDSGVSTDRIRNAVIRNPRILTSSLPAMVSNTNAISNWFSAHGVGRVKVLQSLILNPTVITLNSNKAIGRLNLLSSAECASVEESEQFLYSLCRYLQVVTLSDENIMARMLDGVVNGHAPCLWANRSAIEQRLRTTLFLDAAFDSHQRAVLYRALVHENIMRR